MKINVLSCAEQEFIEAVEFYNDQRRGLGFEFAAEIAAAYSRISEFPRAWPEFSSRTRRCRAARFPYGVLYQIRPDQILVLAVMHLQRDPKSWLERSKID